MDIRTLCLGLLTHSDASGYEIKKIFENSLQHFFDASYGSIYPALNRLTEDGLVQCTEQAQDKRPDKKVYSITAAGRMAFLDELMRPPGRDRYRSEFIATMMFADLLPPRHVSDLIDSRVREYRQMLADLQRGCAAGDTGATFVAGLGHAMYSAGLQYLEDNRHLVEGEALMASASSAAD
ncbi:MAG: PadR family transcriptional regulator [Sneathiellaceae bacterium]